MNLLEGVRVTEAGLIAPAIVLTSKLADLGADVIKIELPPLGDMTRVVPPGMRDTGYLHIAWNHNKRSLALDLRAPADRPTFERLVRSSDVFVEGHRPGVMQQWGADYESVRRLRDDIIYCSLTGFGQTGPYSRVPAQAVQVTASSGLMDVRISEEGQPVVDGPLPESLFLAAGQAALAIVAALLRRKRTGKGAYLDMSIWDAALSWQGLTLTHLANLGVLPPRPEEYGPRYAAYFTKDRHLIWVSLLLARDWGRFCEVVNRSDLLAQGGADGPISGNSEQPELAGEIAGIVAQRTLHRWLQLAIDERLPLAPMQDARSLYASKQRSARGMFAPTMDHRTGGSVHVGSMVPVRVDGAAFKVARPAPSLGGDTTAVLAELEVLAAEASGDKDREVGGRNGRVVDRGRRA
jgi:crotonobetainyl-CoA:carnitine CoA-transferase CaiB-like acyl-CoA transferase